MNGIRWYEWLPNSLYPLNKSGTNSNFSIFSGISLAGFVSFNLGRENTSHDDKWVKNTNLCRLRTYRTQISPLNINIYETYVNTGKEVLHE